MSGYSARQTPDGQVVVVCPNGLDWETDSGQLPTLESAQAYALSLNEWLDKKPDPSHINPFFSSDPEREVSVMDLLFAIDRLYLAEERLDLLSQAISKQLPQEATNGRSTASPDPA